MCLAASVSAGVGDATSRPAEAPAMTMAKLLKRVEILEEKVGALEELPARVDALSLQILELRDTMAAEFSATRALMRTGDQETRTELRAEIAACKGDLQAKVADCREELRSEIVAAKDELRGEIGSAKEELRGEYRASEAETRALMRTLNDETRAHMLVLHEDVIERIKRLGDGWSGTPRTSDPRARARPPRRRR